ncbi:MAG: WecB/TagA/CpsF family glycosyltransferase, partial [Candidatus Omnitrophica bacterium]|nr:WecB/TagA/CpsF family glycosyltransferase [Candidatus Omnitrophota bacterium]
QDPALMEIISSCDMINADGMSVVWASRLLGKALKERVTGIDLMQRLVERSASRGYALYFLGARKEVVERVVGIYKEKFPDIHIAGYRDGYWREDEEPGLVRDIRDSGAQILFLAISSPRKERFLSRYLAEMNVPFVMGVGGSFDVVAGVTRRAPVWMQKSGLEWFYRFSQEPARMWKRYIPGNMRFIGLVCRELVRARSGAK